jgi:hypothetical protein
MCATGNAVLQYYHQRRGLNSVHRRASECVELYLRFMHLQALVLYLS